MQIEDLRCILVAGAGTMGQQIAVQCAMHGYEVIVYDVSPNALETARARIEGYVAQLVSERQLASGDSEPTLGRISFTGDPNDGAKADLLSESIPEDLVLKARVFAQFNAICPPHTIFTTDTSTLLPSMFADPNARWLAIRNFVRAVWRRDPCCHEARIMPGGVAAQ